MIDAAREFFPEVARWDDPRVEIMVGDGIAYMKTLSNEVDLVLGFDWSSWTGWGAFTEEFYRYIKTALKEDELMAPIDSPFREKNFYKR